MPSTIPTPTLRSSIKLSLLLVLASICSPLSVSAQEPDSESIEKVSIGLAGKIRLGHWTPITLKFQPGTTSDRPTDIAIKCLDGEGTPAVYRSKLSFDPGHADLAQSWFRLGRLNGDIEVQLLKGDAPQGSPIKLIAENDFEVIPSTTNTVLLIDTDELFRTVVDTASTNSGGGRIVQTLEDIGNLPTNPFALQGVSQIYLSASETSAINQLSDLQIQALSKWVENGGHLVLSAGQGSGKLLGDQGRFSRFCPGSFDEVVQLNSASRIKFFADSDNEPIEENETLAACKVSQFDGISRLSQEGVQLIVESATGFGTITFVAVDLYSEKFLAWDGVGSFVRKLFFGEIETTSPELKSMAGGRVSHYGYDDLVGQLRVPLDQFSSVRFVTFTWVAVLIGLYILLIGPGDYFFLRKVVGRMELTWLTFGLTTLAFCGVAWLMAKNAKPAKVQLNQVEIIDIDANTGRTRGFVWGNMFSPSTMTHDVSLAESNRYGMELDSRLVTWQGLPGTGLGGMQSAATSTLVAEAYGVELQSDLNATTSTLDQFPVRVSSSKPVFGYWTGKNSSRPQSRLRFNERIKQLEGTFTNPFDEPLKDCRLMFENSVYRVGRTLEPGETISVLEETREKNVRSYFTRRVSVDDKGTNVAWDPTDTDVLRIADVMMFYDAAGGQGYIGLTHSYQGFTDLSRLPHLNRAILVGELPNHVSEFVLDDKSLSDNYDQETTLVRIVLPVSRGSSN